MSGGTMCTCKPQDRDYWVVTHRYHNHSYFKAGPKGSWHSSDYSSVHCTRCLHTWRTTAQYVHDLPGDCACNGMPRARKQQ